MSYAGAWGASQLWRRLRTTPAPTANLRFATLGDVRLAYLDTAGEGVPAVLIHGSPGSSRVFRGLVPLLAPERRYLIPDLPGFGASTEEIPDYSFRAHARYLIEWLDELSISRAHLLGFSMGGGVALSVVNLAPERVASIAMLAAIGVQEHELTGSYALNHALHGAQLAALWSLRAATPHFGWLDRGGLDVSYARNFFDSDQRPLRAVLQRYAGPMLILHGTRDRNVPVDAAREHHRLVPQSELKLFDSDHFTLFENPRWLAPELDSFWQRCDRSMRNESPPEQPSP